VKGLLTKDELDLRTNVHLVIKLVRLVTPLVSF
jgi:hypothetical protein